MSGVDVIPFSFLCTLSLSLPLSSLLQTSISLHLQGRDEWESSKIKLFSSNAHKPWFTVSCDVTLSLKYALGPLTQDINQECLRSWCCHQLCSNQPAAVTVPLKFSLSYVYLVTLRILLQKIWTSFTSFLLLSSYKREDKEKYCILFIKYIIFLALLCRLWPCSKNDRVLSLNTVRDNIGDEQEK